MYGDSVAMAVGAVDLKDAATHMVNYDSKVH